MKKEELERKAFNIRTKKEYERLIEKKIKKQKK